MQELQVRAVSMRQIWSRLHVRGRQTIVLPLMSEETVSAEVEVKMTMLSRLLTLLVVTSRIDHNLLLFGLLTCERGDERPV